MSSITEAAAERAWPDYAAGSFDGGLATVCAACRAKWRVHPDLGGYRLRCDCGAWVAVPPAAPRPALLRTVHARLRPMSPHAGSCLAPSSTPLGDGPVRAAPASEPARGPVRSSPGLFATLLLGALAVVPALLLTTVAPAEFAVYRPWSALAGALVLLVAGLAAWPVGAAEPVRAPGARHVVEALALVLAGLGVIVVTGGAGSSQALWRSGLSESLGTGWTLFLCALGPAVFEELAFRGLLQGRAVERLGRFAGIGSTALVFAFAHGTGPAFPLVLGAGLYLGWLRERAGTIVPGMLARFGFEATLVLGVLA